MEGAYNKKFNGSVASQCAGNSCNGNPCCSFSEQEVVDCTLDGADNCKVGGGSAVVEEVRVRVCCAVRVRVGRCCSFSEQEVVDCTVNGADKRTVGGQMRIGVLTL